ncbi:MAG TPA: glycerol-3-phosphate acyltransferase [Acidimicrobiales bacterium]|jgi:glycerol-3-phosphate acyltransferase PlsY|nr:glycerol-3-phosphate acyltransferase [Acidimicrobiales bacterium]
MSGRLPRPLAHTDALPAPAVLAVAFLCGAVPFSNIAARLVRGVDLRDVGTGTVSGTALHEVAGFGPLAVAGVLEVAKGSVGPVLAGRNRPALAAAAGGAAVAGHNWSPFLRGAGGRGISPATGALLVSAPTGAAVLLGGLAAGRVARQTALVSLIADVALVPVARRLHGERGGMAAAAVVGVIVAKRLAGNAPAPRATRWTTLRHRLLFDRD